MIALKCKFKMYFLNLLKLCRFLPEMFLIETFYTELFCVTLGVVSRCSTIFNNSNFQGAEIYISQLCELRRRYRLKTLIFLHVETRVSSRIRDFKADGTLYKGGRRWMQCTLLRYIFSAFKIKLIYLFVQNAFHICSLFSETGIAEQIFAK